MYIYISMISIDTYICLCLCVAMCQCGYVSTSCCPNLKYVRESTPEIEILKQTDVNGLLDDPLLAEVNRIALHTHGHVLLPDKVIIAHRKGFRVIQSGGIFRHRGSQYIYICIYIYILHTNHTDRTIQDSSTLNPPKLRGVLPPVRRCHVCSQGLGSHFDNGSRWLKAPKVITLPNWIAI